MLGLRLPTFRADLRQQIPTQQHITTGGQPGLERVQNGLGETPVIGAALPRGHQQLHASPIFGQHIGPPSRPALHTGLRLTGINQKHQPIQPREIGELLTNELDDTERRPRIGVFLRILER